MRDRREHLMFEALERGETAMVRELTEARAEVEMLRAAIGKLHRGCDCEHDYRCSMCAAILKARDLLEEGGA